MWINQSTGKGWTDSEETLFSEMQNVSRLNRVRCIQLYRRCKSNPEKALAMAKRDYPKRLDARLTHLAKARAAKA
jgi:hypothetical protein